MPGVISTHVGYTQGHKVSPTYKEVCTGTTGHTEAIRIVYDPNVVSYKSLVQLGLDRLGDNIYLLNQVGNDRGTQYRHGIYYHNDDQQRVADELLNERRRSAGEREVMTELKKAQAFYMAEEYHQQYLLKGGQSAKKGADESIRCYG
jgi:peptide-methionine (S)-S-oxide reductase